MPEAVSAIRTGGLPSRGSGVTVFVTKPSNARATAGAVRASRQPDALSSCKDRSFYTKALPLALDLDRAPVARAVAAGHRRLPRELGRGRQPLDRLEHGLGATGEDVVAVADQLRDEHRLDRHLGLRHEHGRLGMPLAPEAEDCGRAAEHPGQVRERRDADATADEERALDVESEAVPERPEDGERVAGTKGTERARPGADRIDQERELAG